MKLVLTSKGSWGVVPGERVATVSGEEDNVNSAIEEILAVVAVSRGGATSPKSPFLPSDTLKGP